MPLLVRHPTLALHLSVPAFVVFDALALAAAINTASIRLSGLSFAFGVFRYRDSPTLAGHPPVKSLFPFGVFPKQTATHTRFTSPGCAAPSGFLNLLTLYSIRPLPTLFHAGSTHGL